MTAPVGRFISVHCGRSGKLHRRIVHAVAARHTDTCSEPSKKEGLKALKVEFRLSFQRNRNLSLALIRRGELSSSCFSRPFLALTWIAYSMCEEAILAECFVSRIQLRAALSQIEHQRAAPRFLHIQSMNACEQVLRVEIGRKDLSFTRWRT